IVLKVHSGIRVGIFEADNCPRGRSHVDAVGADFEIVLHPVLLPGYAPIGSDTADVNDETLAGYGVRSCGDVGGAVKRACSIQMLVPHRVAPNARDILRQAALNDGRGRGARGHVAGYEGETPGRS